MKFIRKKLRNGMTVIMEKRELPVVACSISNRFGAGFEESKIKGIAHFIEHLVFTGTKTRTHEDISREIEKKGGILNAFTGNEITSFWFKLPSEHIFAGLDILSDLLINPTFQINKFEKEKKVIIEEIKMYHDDPARFVYDLIVENLYEKPFGEGIIGTTEKISRLKRDFVAGYFKENYASNNYVVTIVGNADFEKVCEYLENKFKPFMGNKGEIEIKKKHDFTIEERKGIDQVHFVFGAHAPLLTDKDYYALEVLNAYLADGMSSKLFLKIREERGLAYAVRGTINAERKYSYYSIYVGTRKDAISEVQKLILEGFSDIKNMTSQEFEEIKEQLIGLRKISSEESARVMTELLFSELASTAEEYYEHEKRIKAVSLEQVKNLAKKLVSEYSTAAIVPK